MRRLQVPGIPMAPLLFLEAGQHVAVVDGPYRGARGIVLRRTEGRPDLVRYLVQLERYRKNHWLPRGDITYVQPARRAEVR